MSSFNWNDKCYGLSCPPSFPKDLNTENKFNEEEFKKNWRPSEYCLLQNGYGEHCTEQWCKEQRENYSILDSFWNESINPSGVTNDGRNIVGEDNFHEVHPPFVKENNEQISKQDFESNLDKIE